MSQSHDLAHQLTELLRSAQDDGTLNQALQDFELQNPGALQTLAPLWASELEKRDPTRFGQLLKTYLRAEQHHDLINQLLTLLNPLDDADTYYFLYAQVATIERFNADVLALARSTLDDETVLHRLSALGLNRGAGLTYYGRDYIRFSDETATALYTRNPKTFDQIIVSYLSNKFDYPHLKQAAYPHRAEGEVYWQLFRMTATRDEWQAELSRLAASSAPADTAEKELNKRHPSADYEPDEPLFFRLVETFGESILNYLGRFSARFGRAAIQTALDTARDDEDLLHQMNMLRYQQRKGLERSADLWAPALLRRNPALFEKFLKHHLSGQHRDVIRDMLPAVRANGLLDLYQALYKHVVDEAGWNRQIVTLAQQALSPGELLVELDWLDVEEVYLDDSTAARLYGRDPELFGDFIRRHIRPGTNYPQLKEAAVHSDFWWVIFRLTATESMWQAEMQTLLDSDTPAETIAVELEKRHLTRLKPNPRILKRFLDQYGAAVLPYFERHVQMLTRQRLQSLLALKPYRGDLRRELDLLARRYPVEFADMIDLWLPALYDSQSDFFDKFILRCLTWQGFRKHGALLVRMLPRMEADGKNRLYSTVYRACVDAPSWIADVRRLAESPLPDEDVRAALDRRAAWHTLPDDLAARLYERNPVLFAPYIRNHVGWRQDYLRLLRLARQRDDLALIRTVEQRSGTAPDWRPEVKRLIDNPSLAAAEVVRRLREITTDYRSPYDQEHWMLILLERYGAPLLDYMVENARWIIGNSDRARDAVLNVARQTGNDYRYWEIFFQVADSNMWNDALRDLLRRNLPADKLWFELEKCLPPPERNPRWRSRWELDPVLALRFHALDPQRAYPLLTRYLNPFTPDLFRQAQRLGDDDLLDYITYQLLINWQPDQTLLALATERLRQLYADSPENYVQHAATIMGHIRAFQVYGAKRLQQNPVFNTLANDYPDAWLASPRAIRDLLESPNIYAQIMALGILHRGGAQAAQRVIEDLFLLRAFLLSRARINSKMKVLDCLEQTAGQSADYAQAVLMVIEEVMDFEGKRAVQEQAIAAYGRIKRQLAEEKA